MAIFFEPTLEYLLGYGVRSTTHPVHRVFTSKTSEGNIDYSEQFGTSSVIIMVGNVYSYLIKTHESNSETNTMSEFQGFQAMY